MSLGDASSYIIQIPRVREKKRERKGGRERGECNSPAWVLWSKLRPMMTTVGVLFYVGRSNGLYGIQYCSSCYYSRLNTRFPWYLCRRYGLMRLMMFSYADARARVTSSIIYATLIAVRTIVFLSFRRVCRKLIFSFYNTSQR